MSVSRLFLIRVPCCVVCFANVVTTCFPFYVVSRFGNLVSWSGNKRFCHFFRSGFPSWKSLKTTFMNLSLNSKIYHGLDGSAEVLSERASDRFRIMCKDCYVLAKSGVAIENEVVRILVSLIELPSSSAVVAPAQAPSSGASTDVVCDGRVVVFKVLRPH